MMDGRTPFRALSALDQRFAPLIPENPRVSVS